MLRYRPYCASLVDSVKSLVRYYTRLGTINRVPHRSVCAGVSAWRSQGVAPAHRVSLPYFSLAGAAVPLSAAGSLASV